MRTNEGNELELNVSFTPTERDELDTFSTSSTTCWGYRCFVFSYKISRSIETYIGPGGETSNADAGSGRSMDHVTESMLNRVLVQRSLVSATSSTQQRQPA